jgi:hypothetical protein
MNETRAVETKLGGQRGRGRPRVRWINNVEDDLRKLDVKRCRMKALDREEWASIIREAKAKLKGP